MKSQQKMYLYINAELVNAFVVSTGKNYPTPDFDTHPNGRIYDEYNSKIFPGGNYQGLGNMPYAVFIASGFAIHGTTEPNFKYLGQPASHGCIRLHPTNAYIFNRLVREYGIHNVWITVQE
ncbi:MAG: L,D-transpeptidase [Bdellovibrionota bacterium]